MSRVVDRALQASTASATGPLSRALESAWRKKEKAPPKRGSRLDPHHQVIDEWLRDDLDAPRKQRHTAKRIFDRSSVNATPRACCTGWSESAQPDIDSLPVTTDITETWAVQGPRSVAGDRLVARRGGTCP